MSMKWFTISMVTKHWDACSSSNNPSIHPGNVFDAETSLFNRISEKFTAAFNALLLILHLLVKGRKTFFFFLLHLLVVLTISHLGRSENNLLPGVPQSGVQGHPAGDGAQYLKFPVRQRLAANWASRSGASGSPWNDGVIFQRCDLYFVTIVHQQEASLTLSPVVILGGGGWTGRGPGL